MGKADFDFANEVALVTGVAGGLGSAVARALAAAGARVHGVDRVEPEGFDGTFHTVDLRESAEVEALISTILEREGRIDHLVHAAGVTRDRMFWNLSDEDWESVIDVNLNAAHRLLRALAPSWRKAGAGNAVLLTSINGMRAKAGVSNYAASKAGLIALGRTAARELGPRGIRVNLVAPGMIAAGMGRQLPEEVLSRAVDETALGRLGQAEDISSGVLFLLSDAAAHITAAVLPIDGGQLA
ncbi:MAG TPA: SDR family oxidoreductase [Polyangiaceae bacterium]|nr:SDR family oxidoreductase [Polyangiaceae bacterium]